MPRPLFIICSESTSQDSENNILSLFNIIERFDVEAVLKNEKNDSSQSDTNATRQPFVQMMSFSVTVTWMKLPGDDPRQEYEHQLVMCQPDGSETIIMKGTGLYFESDERPLIRRIFKIHGPPFQKPGQYRAESWIRRAGSDDQWIRQDHPFLVTVKEMSDEEFSAKHQRN